MTGPKAAPDLVERVKRIIYGAAFGARTAELHEEKIDCAARAVVALVLEEATACADQADSLELATHGPNKIVERLGALKP